MKKITLIIILIAANILFVSCSVKSEGADNEEVLKPVKVVEIREEVIPVKLDYIGTVLSDQMKKVAFKSSGKIESISIKKGQSIKKGDVLAKLDTTDLEFALKASKAQMEGARAQYNKALNGAAQEDIKKAEENLNKARAAYDFSKQSFANIENLYKNEAVSRLDYDRAKLDMDIRKSELNQAEEVYTQVVNGTRQEDKKMLLSQLEQAKADYEYKSTLVEDASLKSDVDGYVVDILYKEGEMVPSGYPVIVIRNNNQIVKTGLSQNDYSKIKVGTRVKLEEGELLAEGVVASVEQVPDAQTRTYGVEVSINESPFQIGAIVKVSFIIGEENGISVPISSIISNGQDYVYIVDAQNRVVKKQVELGEAKGSLVVVEGVSSGDKVVVEGMKRLNDKDKVNIIE